MRALVYANHALSFERHYSDPALVEGEALIRVLLAGICNTDLEIVRGYMGFQGVLGHEFVGIVEAVHEGPGATSLRPLPASISSSNVPAQHMVWNWQCS